MYNHDGRKNFRQALTSTALIGLLAVLLTVSGSAQDTSNELNVNVTITGQTIIDIQPSSFAWGLSGAGLEPGTFAGPSEELNSYGRIQVENLGSVNISQVWFNTTAPAQRPFGTADSSLYDSANFIQLSSNDSTAGPLRSSNTFVERTEYGIDSSSTQDIIYLETNNGWDFGRFRNGSQEYFWTVDDTTAGLAGATFRIGLDHHNSTQTGSTNLDQTCVGGDEATAGGASCNGYSLTEVTAGGTTYGVTEVEIGAEDTNLAAHDGGANYCAVMDSTQVTGTNNPEVEFIKWNANNPAVQASPDCQAVTQYMINGTELAPGAWETMNIRANIPYGVVSGTLPTGQLTVLANSN